MNFTISNIAKGVLALFLFFAVASCSSTKKIQDLENAKMDLQNAYDECMASQSKLKNDLAESKNEKAKLEEDLDAKSMEMQALKNVIDENNQKMNKMKAELKVAFAGFQGVKIEEKAGRLIVTMPNKILFQSAKVDLDAKGLEAIQTISKVFKNNQGLNILVEGHTDDIPIKNPRFKDNWDLSVSRAVVVVRLLEKYGVNPTRMTAAGRGEFVPVANVAPLNAETRAQNRRTEFIITPKTQGLYKLLNDL